MLKNFAKGLLFGAAAGAVGGLLLAPNSGNETRRKVRDSLDEMTDLTMEVNDSLNNFKDALATTIATAEEIIPAVQSGIEKDVRQFQFQAEPRVAQIMEQLEKIQKGMPQDSASSIKTVKKAEVIND
ncbi:YtxH domain-containing protein [Enterococcus sp. LJL90]